MCIKNPTLHQIVRNIDVSHLEKVITNNKTKHEPAVFFLSVHAKEHHKGNKLDKECQLKDAIVAKEPDVA